MQQQHLLQKTLKVRKHPCGLDEYRENINDTRKELSTLAEIKRDEFTHNMKRKRLLRKCNIEKENLDQVIEELQQKYRRKLSGCLHTENDKLSTIKMKCKNFYSLLRQRNTNVKKHTNWRSREILEEIQGIHKRMVRFIWFIQLIPHHSVVYTLYMGETIRMYLFCCQHNLY
jgi:hypothetical protein